jgi:hypothetical protein
MSNKPAHAMFQYRCTGYFYHGFWALEGQWTQTRAFTRS